MEGRVAGALVQYALQRRLQHTVTHAVAETLVGLAQVWTRSKQVIWTIWLTWGVAVVGQEQKIDLG